MSRKRTYNHIRFDGGMTDSPRDTSDLSKLAYISHLDIYRDHTRMFVMPGYESFSGFDGDPNGIKVYQPQDIAVWLFSRIVLLAKKSDGTGSKIFMKETTDTQWKIDNAFFRQEGNADLTPEPFFMAVSATGAFFYPTNDSGFTNITRHPSTGALNPSFAAVSIPSSLPSRATQAASGDVFYGFWGVSNVHRISPAEVSSVNFKTTGISFFDLHASDYTIGIAGNLNTSTGLVARNLIWDNASLLADQNNLLGRGFPAVVGSPSQVYTFVMDEGVIGGFPTNELQNNGESTMAVKVLQGESVNTVYSRKGFFNAGGTIKPTKGLWRDAMTWYARVPQNSAGSSFAEGVWAFGKGDINSQMGVSLLLDTTSLGSVLNVRWVGNTAWFINHSGDGSISRLQNFETGTYNVPATIETLIYGADSPYQKELQGISIVTEDLPAGSSVECYYRIDEDSAWTVMGTSNETGKRRHSFTKANGTPIGKFQEIQFKIVITGKTAVKNIRVDTIETENLPY